MSRELLVATRNQGKLREIRTLLAESGIQVLSLADFSELPEVTEDGATFAENARKKAETIARRSGRLTLADDSGLLVATLDGAPGVHSARYAGPDADDAANNRKLLAALHNIPAARRQAAFVCVMALCSPQGACRFYEGRLEGAIVDAPRGAGGFGYDPLFFIAGQGKTLAELPAEIKNRISHRGQALRQALAELKSGV
ncbi:MAG: XTP/dITP diphosphatase [Desulfuromonadales bacterium]